MRTVVISKDTSNIIKALACLLIVAHHFCARLIGNRFDNVIVNFIGVRGGVIGVTLFFFLSAWGLSESQIKNQYSFTAFVKRRLAKVYLPLIVSNVIYYLYLLYFNHFSFNLHDFVLKALNLRRIDGVLWFCNTILSFYLIFFISFLPKTKWQKVGVCVAATIMYSVLSTIIFPDSPFYVYSIIGFPAGMICSLYKDSILKLSTGGLWSVVTITLLFVGALIIPTYKNLFLMNCICFIILVITVIVIQWISFSNKMTVLPFIGKYSYEIYLLHNKVLDSLGNAGNTNWYPLAFLIVVIPLSILLNKLVKLMLNTLYINKSM